VEANASNAGEIMNERANVICNKEILVFMMADLPLVIYIIYIVIGLFKSIIFNRGSELLLMANMPLVFAALEI